jgi:hypothetical protein
MFPSSVYKLFDRAGVLFRTLHGDRTKPPDRLGPMNDLLIAPAAWRIGASFVTGNRSEFNRIAPPPPGLVVVESTEWRPMTKLDATTLVPFAVALMSIAMATWRSPWDAIGR